MVALQLLHFFFICIVVSAYGLPQDESKENGKGTQSVDLDCRMPKLKRAVRGCCKIPRRRIWGDLGASFQACGKKIRIHRHYREKKHLKMIEDDEPLKTAVAERSELSLNVETMAPSILTNDSYSNENLKKNYYYHRKGESECFMECVFRLEGFLTKNKLNKNAILKRLEKTLLNNDGWRDVALAAAEKCIQLDFPTSSPCRSGSEAMFYCVFKELFFNCPNWPANNEYCDSLKEFYRKCPNGPPRPYDEKLEDENKTDMF